MKPAAPAATSAMANIIPPRPHAWALERAGQRRARHVEEERSKTHAEVDERRSAHSGRLPEGRHDEHDARERRDGRPKRVDEVEVTDALSDVAALAHRVRDEERERAAHEHRRDEHEEEGDERRRDGREVEGERPNQWNNGSDASPKAPIDSSTSPNKRRAGRDGSFGDRAARQASEPEAQHERRDDDRDRLDVDFINGKQRALPDDLVEERREPRREEHEQEPRHSPPHRHRSRALHTISDALARLS